MDKLIKPLYVTVQQACKMLGRKRQAVWKLHKAGKLKKTGKGRGTRIEVASIEALLAEWKNKPTPNRAKPTVKEIKLAEKLDRLLEQPVNPQTGIPRTPMNPYGDPRLEPCVFEGVVVSVAERDAMVAYRNAVARARRLGGRLVAGV